ncbi:MAG TPA: MaoC/PaaZ C-terminal domain-containing protein [Xanthobacteraceae bacterium]
MPINYDKLLALKIPEVTQAYTEKDAILYALGVGLGRDPMDEDELPFVYEQNLKVLPTFAAVLGWPGFWVRDLDTGIDWVKVVAGEQALVLHRPLGGRGTVVGRTRVTEIIDKGAGKGALVLSERALIDSGSGQKIATVTQTTFCRGDGGFGGPAREAPSPHPIPERPPDLTCDRPTRPEAALIYRLSGDPNPLHADPRVAKAAGFPRPILHGLASFGIACHGILTCLCGHDTGKLKAISGRYSAPVFPGETIRTEMWRDGALVSFRARVVERDVIALNNGRCELTG